MGPDFQIHGSSFNRQPEASTEQRPEPIQPNVTVNPESPPSSSRYECYGVRVQSYNDIRDDQVLISRSQHTSHREEVHRWSIILTGLVF